jgi:hypothetical protein
VRPASDGPIAADANNRALLATTVHKADLALALISRLPPAVCLQRQNRGLPS